MPRRGGVAAMPGTTRGQSLRFTPRGRRISRPYDHSIRRGAFERLLSSRRIVQPFALSGARHPMWFIQTSVDALLLPTDGAGRCTLTGSATAWQHLVRGGGFTVDARADVAEMPVRWSIWPWEQAPRRVQLPDALAGYESLAFMVRAEPTKACVFVNFPKPGKRKNDGIIEVIVVVPPETFSRYETLVHFAMTLPAGYVALTLPAPAVTREHEAADGAPVLIEPGSNALMQGLEMVVARAKPQKFSKADIRPERRSTTVTKTNGLRTSEEDEEWLAFAAAPIHEQVELEEGAEE
jgi:hypothetical protein